MKYIIIFIYWLTTWILKYVINFFELLWNLDIKHFSYYGTHFLTIKDIKETEIQKSVYNTIPFFNVFEQIIYYCTKK